MENLWVYEGNQQQRRKAKKTSCNHCQGDFLQRVNGSAIFCSVACRISNRALSSVEEKTCIHCKHVFQRARSKNKGSLSFCKRACRIAYFALRKKPCTGHCETCNSVILTGKFCNKNCEQVYRIDVLRKKMYNGERIHEMTAKKILLIDRGHHCEKCRLSQWQDEKIPLDLHHKDGDSSNNLPSNLDLLCKNCHALTPNYGIKNKGKGRDRRRYMRYRKNKTIKGL